MSGATKDSTHQPFDEYFRLTQELPRADQIQEFLHLIPEHGCILDFGCGTGRWALAFLRDRPDLTIDLVDKNLDKSNLIPPDWTGEKFHLDFNDFTPCKTYDAIWAFSALFFLSPEEIPRVMHTLSNTLKLGGITEFTMVDDCVAATAANFTGMNRQDIKKMLQKEHLIPIAIQLDNDAEYGLSKLKIPTFYIRARKMVPKPTVRAAARYISTAEPER